MAWTWPITGLVVADGADSDGSDPAYRIQIDNSTLVNLCPSVGASFVECHYSELFPANSFSLDFDIATVLAALDVRGTHDWYTLQIGVAFPDILNGKMDPIDGGGRFPGCKGLFDPGGPAGSYCMSAVRGIDSAGDIVMDGGSLSFDRLTDGTVIGNAGDSTQQVGTTEWRVPYDPANGDAVPCPDPMYPDTSNDAYVLLWQHDQLLDHAFTFRAGGTWTWTDLHSAGSDAVLHVGLTAYDASTSPTVAEWMCVL